jgi:hypothetical protein
MLELQKEEKEKGWLHFNQVKPNIMRKKDGKKYYWFYIPTTMLNMMGIQELKTIDVYFNPKTHEVYLKLIE